MFRQQLASRTHQSNERAVQGVVNATMQTFMEKCRATADQGRCFCSVTKINIQPLCYMAGGAELVVQKFKEQMAEMGFPNGVGNPYESSRGGNFVLDLTATWEAEDTAACTVEEAARGGTRVTCPICHEHRPGVALIPCGHVMCRDCQLRFKKRREEDAFAIGAVLVSMLGWHWGMAILGI